MAIINLKSTVQKLINAGRLGENHSIRGYFTTNRGKRGYWFFEMFENKVYFYAKLFGDELPCKSYRVTRKTILEDCINQLSFC